MLQISIIIPIYQAEARLKECLESVASQNFKDFEVLLVDDGSTDGSSAICREFCAVDSRFIYIRQENRGASAARNTGLDKARGEYICYGAFDGGAILAYAFFVLMGRKALFDYFAVDEALRDRGIGSRFLRALIGGPLSGMDCVLLEVDDPGAAPTSEERQVRERRLAFYLNNGLEDTHARATVYGVDYVILSLPVGPAPDSEQARRVYADLYRAILPPRFYDRWVVVRGLHGQ